MLTINELIAAFRSAAIAKGDFARPTRRDHELHEQMCSALHELRRLGETGEAAFRELLTDSSAHVRGWVAAELLSRGDQDALGVLEDLSANLGLVGFSASMTLREYEAGRLKSAFPEG